MTDDRELHARITHAREQLADAEQKLADILAQLEAGVRADKIIIGPSLQTAFDEVAAARRDLESLVDDG